jgi:hypothetical protein
MIVSEAKLRSSYFRFRNGKRERCWTTQTIYHIRCDNCEREFTRTAKEINRASAAHCCDQCDPKRFAQKQSATLRQYNKWDASSGKTI